MLTETPQAAADRPLPEPAGITFPQGLPGFPGACAFRLEPFQGRFHRLACTAPGGPAFILFQPVRTDLLTEDDIAAACASCGLDPEAVSVLFVVSVARQGDRATMTVNRRAPILLDGQRGLGFQPVLPQAAYAIRHPLAAEA